MFVINKLILPDQKEMKKLPDLLHKNEKVLHHFCKKDGLTHSESFIQEKLSIHGGV
jgi:hypothetical protein